MKKSLLSVLFVLSISFAAIGNVPSKPLPDLPVKSSLKVYTDFEAEFMAFVNASYYHSKAHNENGDTLTTGANFDAAVAGLAKYSKKALADSIEARWPIFPYCWIKCSHEYYECIREFAWAAPSITAKHCRRAYEACMRTCPYTPIEE